MRIFAALSLAAAVAACGGPVGAPAPGAAIGPDPGAIRLSEQFTGDYALIDTGGAAVADEDLRGRVVFAYFGFATCPDVCPLALGRMSAALDLLSDAERAEIAPVFFTVDPARDTPEALGAYLQFDPRIRGLTGSEDAVAAARAGFKVFAAPRPAPESAAGYTMDHTSLFYVVDRAGRPQLALPDTMAPDGIAQSLRAALAWR